MCSAAPTSSSKINGQKFTEGDIADHSWRQNNHIWTADEVEERIATSTQKFAPVKPSDYLMRGIMRSMYHTFNFVTGYKVEDPSPSSIEWRLIILESFAGVPGFVAAGFRHFHSLRTLQRDHGMIFTLLEEAENERMHLLTCLRMFEANKLTQALVIGAQFSMTPFLMLTYAVHPPAMHRFVGYLEETAVDTYANIVRHVEKEGTQLHKAWHHLPAPEIAVNYWKLAEHERTWLATLKRMLADEAHHRDVNHTFASLPPGASNPFILDHMNDFDAAAARRVEKILKSTLGKQQ